MLSIKYHSKQASFALGPHQLFGEGTNGCKPSIQVPLQIQKILGLKSEIQDRSIVALDQENHLDTHYVWFGCELMNPNSQL